MDDSNEKRLKMNSISKRRIHQSSQKRQTFQLNQLMTQDLNHQFDSQDVMNSRIQLNLQPDFNSPNNTKPLLQSIQERRSSERQTFLTGIKKTEEITDLEESIDYHVPNRFDKLHKLERDLDEISLELKMDQLNDLYCRKQSCIYIEQIKHADYSLRLNKTVVRSSPKTIKRKASISEQQDFSSMKIDDLREHEHGILNMLSDQEHPPTTSSLTNIFKVKLSSSEYESIFENKPTFYEKQAFVDIFRKKWKQDKGYCSIFNKRLSMKAKKNKLNLRNNELQVQGSGFKGTNKDLYDTYFQIQNSIKQKTMNLMIDKNQFLYRAANALNMEKQNLQSMLNIDDILKNTNEIPVCKAFPLPKYQRTLKANIDSHSMVSSPVVKRREKSQKRRFESTNIEEHIVQYQTLLRQKRPGRRSILSLLKDESKSKGIFFS